MSIYELDEFELNINNIKVSKIENCPKKSDIDSFLYKGYKKADNETSKSIKMK